MKIAGAIIAGGSGTRLGGVEKLLMPFGAGLLIDSLIGVVGPQVDRLALNVRGQSRPLYGRWTADGLALLHDPYPAAIGPLGGVVAGLEWVGGLEEDFEWLATFPGDAPSLPNDLVCRLLDAAMRTPTPRPAVAHDGDRVQSLCAIWPRRCLAELRSLIDGAAVRGVQRALTGLQSVQVNFEDRDMFININTSQDLGQAERLTFENPTAVFDFEQDFASSLRCIPMAVRFKLDLCGIKLSLRQWSRFTREDRARLLQAPCGSPSEVAAYRAVLIELVSTRANETAKDIAVETAPAWLDAATVPAAIVSHAVSVDLRPPTLEQWSGLRPLERFALMKLSRDNHDNVNFKPAMIEFGLLSAEGQVL